MDFFTFILVTIVISIVIYIIWKIIVPDKAFFFFAFLVGLPLTYLLFGPSHVIHYEGNYTSFDLGIFPFLKLISFIAFVFFGYFLCEGTITGMKEKREQEKQRIRSEEVRKRNIEEAEKKRKKEEAEKKRKEIEAERKRIEAEAEMERDRPFREVRKQKATELFHEFQTISSDLKCNEGMSYKIRPVIGELADFATDHINMTDADLEEARNLLREIRRNWKKVEVEGFAEKRRGEERDRELRREREEERWEAERAEILWAEEEARERQRESDRIQERILEAQREANRKE